MSYTDSPTTALPSTVDEPRFGSPLARFSWVEIVVVFWSTITVSEPQALVAPLLFASPE